MYPNEVYVTKDASSPKVAYRLFQITTVDGKPGWTCEMFQGHGGKFWPMTGRVSSVVDPSATYTGLGTVTEEWLTIGCELSDINLGHWITYTHTS